MKCEDCRRMLIEAIAGDGEARPAAETSRHLEACPACREWWRGIQAVAQCLSSAEVPSIEPPPIAAVWARIESVSGGAPRRAAQPWWLDVLEVLAAASAIVLVSLVLHTVAPGILAQIPWVSRGVAGTVQDPVTFSGILALLGMLAGACSAPILFEKQAECLRRST